MNPNLDNYTTKLAAGLPYILPPYHQVYKPWREAQPSSNLQTPGSGAGGMVEHILRSAIMGEDLAPFGLTPEGTRWYQNAAQGVRAWSTNNAQFAYDNRDNQSAIQDRLIRDLTDQGLMPQFNIGAWDKARAWGGFGELGKYNTASGGNLSQDNVIEGFRSALNRNSSQYAAALSPGIRRKLLSNMGKDLGSFYTNLLKNLGKGSTSMLTSLLRNFSPTLAKSIDNLANINKGMYLPKPKTPVQTPAQTLAQTPVQTPAQTPSKVSVQRSRQ